MRTVVRLCTQLAFGSALLSMQLVVNAQAIDGFKHDFTTKSWDTTDKTCVICHTPHNTTVDWPLWNYSITKSAYTLYVIREEDSERNRPEGTSKLCLSCHDGTVAVDAFGGTGGSARKGVLNEEEKKNLSSLRPEHPISILYTSEVAATNGSLLKNPTTTIVYVGDEKAPVTVDAAMLSPAHKVECATCHDVHKTGITDENNYALLTLKMADDQLCLACHLK